MGPAARKPCWSHAWQCAAAAAAVGLLLLVLGAALHLDIWHAGFAGRGHGSSGRQHASGWRHSELLPAHRWTVGSTHIFSMSPMAPSRDMYYAIQANPGLVSSDPAVAAEFEAAPWLLPPRTAALPYAGIHDFDRLLQLRSRPTGSYSRSVALLLFSKAYAVMVQNSIYSLVKHGGVRNYVALAWSQEDLQACADLNLPCADVSGMLLEPIITTSELSQRDFLVMGWVKPATVLRALRQGYATMFVDTDVSYAVKPLWESYTEFIARADADGAWQSETPLNSGHFLILPTPAGLAFAASWNSSAPKMLHQKVSDQKALPLLEDKNFVTCRITCVCYRHKYELLAKGQREKVAIFLVYFPAQSSDTNGFCAMGSKEWITPYDPCDWTTLFVHPVCIQERTGTAKAEIIKEIGFWHIDDEQGCQPQPGSASQVPACRPLHWRVPETELRQYSCQSYGLGLVRGEASPAIKELQTGPSVDRARELLKASSERRCNGKSKPLQF